jgi:hypothetical protein
MPRPAGAAHRRLGSAVAPPTAPFVLPLTISSDGVTGLLPGCSEGVTQTTDVANRAGLNAQLSSPEDEDGASCRKLRVSGANQPLHRERDKPDHALVIAVPGGGPETSEEVLGIARLAVHHCAPLVRRETGKE